MLFRTYYLLSVTPKIPKLVLSMCDSCSSHYVAKKVSWIR